METYANFAEAWTALQTGKRIKHQSWGPKEYMKALKKKDFSAINQEEYTQTGVTTFLIVMKTKGARFKSWVPNITEMLTGTWSEV